MENTDTFEVLEHTGDVKIRAFGKTKEELFCGAAAGMFAVLRPTTNDKQPTRKREVRLTAPDINALLVDFLSELNYLRQVHREAYDTVILREFSETGLEAKLSGHKVEGFAEDIKAVTFHDLDIRQNAAGDWETTIVFDV